MSDHEEYSCDTEDDSDEESTDSIDVNVILEQQLEGDTLMYLCKQAGGEKAVFDRSDLMDGAKHQRLVMDFEKRHPPPWDAVCSFCGGEDDGCDECVCDECGQPMRHILGVNYGCVRHPVV